MINCWIDILTEVALGEIAPSLSVALIETTGVLGFASPVAATGLDLDSTAGLTSPFTSGISTDAAAGSSTAAALSLTLLLRSVDLQIITLVI